MPILRNHPAHLQRFRSRRHSRGRASLRYAIAQHMTPTETTSMDSDLHPPTAPPGERYGLSHEKRARSHRISRLLIERTIPAICVGLRRFCNVIAPSRGQITRIQRRQVGMSGATEKEACNRNERACHQATPHRFVAANPLRRTVQLSIRSWRTFRTAGVGPSSICGPYGAYRATVLHC
jgi:hypothetical protein